MNIYNKLFILEYNKDPIYNSYMDKIWYLNMSKQKYWYYHRKFDLTSLTHKDYKYWCSHDKLHRLIGPATLIINNYKSYYIRNKLIFRYEIT